MLNSIIPCLATYVKNDWVFLWFLPSFLNFDCIFCSCDIEGLYTYIPVYRSIEAIEYWIKIKRNLIPERFTKEFNIDCIKFISKNSAFLFDSKMFNQIFRTAVRTKYLPTHSCLTIGYQEETKIFTQELPKYFSIEESEVIKEVCKQYMHNGFIFWPKHLDFEYFRTCLNNLHPAIKYMYRQNKSKLIDNIKGKLIQSDHIQLYQVLKFLDNEVVLHCDNTVEADIYYNIRLFYLAYSY